VVNTSVFEMRGDDGTIYRVQSPFRSERTTGAVVRTGDRVEVRGRYDDDRIIVAESVRLLDGNGNDNGDTGERVTRRGTVINIVNTSVFEIRGDDGTAYRVQAPFRAERTTGAVVRQGDRVEVTGYYDRDRIIVANSVRVLNGNDDGGYGERVTRRGIVVNIVDGATFEMRGDDGTNYRMRTNYGVTNQVAVGDRVEVRGYFDQDRIIITESIRILNRGNNGGSTGERVTRRGTVVNIVDYNTFEMRGEDGTGYRMRTTNNGARRVNIGDRVEVRGYYDQDRIIITDSVQILGRGSVGGGSSEGPDGSAADFTGTVLRADRVLMLWVLQVRTDDGRQYQVNYNGQNNFAANDRVRVVGTFRKGTVVSNNVSRL
jgi:putative component of toxin-antitoxin plasmid stabilization module